MQTIFALLFIPISNQTLISCGAWYPTSEAGYLERLKSDFGGVTKLDIGCSCHINLILKKEGLIMQNEPTVYSHCFQRTNPLLLLTCAVLSFSNSCGSSNSPTISGSFAGTVALYDSTFEALSNFSSTNVVIDGTSFSTSTDPNGHWEINGVPQGLYDITASKSGYGTFHWYQQPMVGGVLDLKPAEIANMSTKTPVISSVTSSGGYWTIIIQPYNSGFLAAYCDVDSTTQPSEAHLATNVFAQSDGYFSYSDLRAGGAQSGETLYFSTSTIFYDDEYASLGETFSSSFFDPYHNETRWASTGPRSNVIAVTMP
jgi:hypothetical protein